MTTTTMTMTMTTSAVFRSGNNNNKCKITICHATSSSTNPYVKITVSSNSNYQGHGNHSGDIIPAPADGCPKKGYNPDDIEAKAWKVDGKVKFRFEGCPKGKRLGVTIDGKTVAGSPFRVPRGGVVSKKVPIPAGADGDVIEFTCPKPYIVWEIDIQPSRPLHSFGSPVAVTVAGRQQPGPGRQSRQPVRQHHRSR